MKKIIIINLIILLAVYFSFEIYCFKEFEQKCGKKLNFFGTNQKDYLPEYPPLRFKEYNSEYNKKLPVLLLGCSFTCGEFIPENQNLSSQLSSATNRWVYNMGVAGHGAVNTLVMLDEEQTQHLIKKAPEYIIYTYMFHHPQRWYYREFYDYYRKHNYIPFQKYNILYKSYIYRHFKDLELENYFQQDEHFTKRLELFYNVMHDIKQISEKLYPESKFIILIYSDINKDLCNGITGSVGSSGEIQELFDIMYSDTFKKKLEDMGYTVISTEDLIGRKMDRKSDRAENDPHHPNPSVKAWNEVVPKLVKKFDM